jgi:dUTP pyrophosphatase
MPYKLYITPLNDNVKNYFIHKQVTEIQHKGDSGIDLVCHDDIEIKPNETAFVKLGLKAEMYKINDTLLFVIAFNIILILYYNVIICCALFFPFIYKRQLKIYINVSWYLYPRSSISKTPLVLHNSIGLIDRDYRGELIAALRNTSDKTYIINKGTRLVQALCPDISESLSFELTNKQTKTERGENGFGSTNKY